LGGKQAIMQANQDNTKRFIYAATFVVAYLLWTVVRGGGGSDNAAVWNLLIGLAVAGGVGAVAGVRMHALLVRMFLGKRVPPKSKWPRRQ
jgi:hypothetical protein